MKRMTKRWLIGLTVFFMSQSLLAITFHANNFNDASPTGWSTNSPDKYSISMSDNGYTVISVNNAGGKNKYQTFSYTFSSPLDLTKMPALDIKIKAWQAANIRIDIVDSDGRSSSENPNTTTVIDDGRFHNYEQIYLGKTNYSDGKEVDITSITKLEFFVNANEASAFTGEIQIDNLLVGDVFMASTYSTVPILREEEYFNDGSLDSGWDIPYYYTGSEESKSDALRLKTKNIGAILNKNDISYSFVGTICGGYSQDLAFDFYSKDTVSITVTIKSVAVKTNNPQIDTYKFTHYGSDKFTHIYKNILTIGNVRTEIISFKLTYTSAKDSLEMYFDNIRIGADLFDSRNDHVMLGIIPDQAVDLGNPFTTIDIRKYIEDLSYRKTNYKLSAVSGSNLIASLKDSILTVVPKNADWVGTDTVTLVTDVTDIYGKKSFRKIVYTVKGKVVDKAPKISNIPQVSLSNSKTAISIGLKDYVNDDFTIFDALKFGLSTLTNFTASIQSGVLTVKSIVPHI